MSQEPIENLSASLRAWFESQPKWVREAATRLFEKGHLGDQDIMELAVIAKSEVGALNEGEVAPEARMPDALLAGSASASQVVRLRAIRDPRGVNRLAPRNPLTFSATGLTVVYGRNGSGKSGYARVLKQACSSPHREDVLPNVFGQEQPEQSCVIQIDVDGITSDVTWSPDCEPHEGLASVRILDSHACQSYLTSQHEAVYEPPIIAVLGQIGGSVAGQVEHSIQEEIEGTDVRSPVAPQGLEGTLAVAKLDGAKKSQDVAGLTSLSTLTQGEQDQLQKLNDVLDAADPAALSQQCARQIESLVELRNTLSSWLDSFNKDAVTRLQALRESHKTKKDAALTVARLLQDDEMIASIGSETWSQLWQYARQYSEGEAYRETEFPYLDDDAKCILCHQPLDDQARERFKRFDAFVKGVAETEAKEATEALGKALRELPAVPDAAPFGETLTACGIETEDDRGALEAARSLSAKWRLWLSEPMGEMPELLGSELLKIVETTTTSTTARKQGLDAQSDPEARRQMMNERKELLGRQWLGTVMEQVPAILARREHVSRLAEAKRMCRTTSITTKNTELTNNLVTEAFVARVREELDALDAASIPICLEGKKGTKGKTPHRLALKDARAQAKAEHVLSEGERRIVAIATFLAHMRGEPSPVTFVFDDPITSLDDEFEDKVVERLAKFADERQVIVFTHRIGLMVKLTDRIGKDNLASVGLESEAWGTGEPRPTPIHAQKAKAAVESLTAELQRLKVLAEREGKASAESGLRKAASDIRICVEDLVERVLLNEVVLRYRRGVQTYNRIAKLSDICQEDCKKIEDWMSKYSAYEHSQPVDGAPSVPTVDDMIVDVDAMLEWIKAVQDRRK